MTKMMMIAMIAGSALALGPGPVAAADCTRQYTKCLNDTWDLKGALQVMADVECFAEYTGCVRKTIIGA